MNYHVTEAGIKRCTAKPGNCPISEQREHFSAKAEAESYYYEKLAKTHEIFPAKTNEIDLPCAFGTMRVKNGDLSDLKSRTALISGLCGSLALAIHDKTGTDPYFVCYGIDDSENLQQIYDEGGRDALTVVATHALVESESEPGTFVDAYGRKTLEELKEFYGDDISLQRGSRAMLVDYAETGVPEILSNFADAAISLDRKGESYSYLEFELPDEDDFD